MGIEEFHAAAPYVSKFRDWDDRARVRVSPRRRLADEESSGKLYFSPVLVPVVDHQLINRLGPAARIKILAQHLYGYLDFTTRFEVEVVNPGAREIAADGAGLNLPDEMRLDAYKIYCDEAYHSVFSADVKRQVESQSRIEALHYDFGAFLTRLGQTHESVPSEMRKLVGLFVVIIFETLISATLNKIPNDEQVITVVREIVADHADDEARHHFYFASLMDFVWPRLSERERSTIGPLLPGIIVKCLEPDYEAIGERLSILDLNRDEIRQVIEESYKPADVIAGIRRTARATLNILERNGLFESAQNLEAFHRSGLLGSEPSEGDIVNPSRRISGSLAVPWMNRTSRKPSRRQWPEKEGILSIVGHTPIIELTKIFAPSNFRLFGKMEAFNPGGSMKDRPALNMLRKALDAGEITRDTVIIESSSGNMGIGLAQACAYLGLRFICVVDSKTTLNNIRLLEAYGAEVELVSDPDPLTGEFLQARLNRVQDLLLEVDNSFWPNQYSNLDNPAAHLQTMHEIVSALGSVDYVFCATSTCGTLRGCADYIASHNLSTKLIAIDAVGSVIFGSPRAKRLIPGHGAGVPPPLFRSDLADEFVLVDDLDCIAGCRRLVKKEAILAGGSAGAVITGIEHFRERIPDGAICVAILADRGERYLDTIFSDEWVEEHFGEVSHLWNTEEGGANMRYGSIMVLNGVDVLSVLDGSEDRIIGSVRQAYESHRMGLSSLPHSTFLRFPDSDRNRIMALPAFLGGENGGAGVKWVASFPTNLNKGMDRASAVVILNSTLTGRPQAIIEGSVINAKRTAASAALAARYLHDDRNVDALGIVGCGLIAFEAQRFLKATFPQIETSYIYDLDPGRAEKFKTKTLKAVHGLEVSPVEKLQDLFELTSLVVLATTAVKPHIKDLSGLRPGSTILHISLRDLAPELILDCDNVVDDIDHVCRAETSVHLAEQMTGNRDFIRCTLADITLGQAPPKKDPGLITVFSPFGLGVLDIALGRLVHEMALKQGRGSVIDSFLPEAWS